jgi:hypothetical protein
VLVRQVDREPVDLELAQVLHVGADRTLDPLSPRLQLCRGEDVVEAEHAFPVLDRTERRRHRSADLLGRRVGRTQVGMRLLELLELAHRRVELRVGHRGVVEHVVAPPGVFDLLGDPAVAFARPRRCGGRRGCRLAVGWWVRRAHVHILPVATDTGSGHRL